MKVISAALRRVVAGALLLGLSHWAQDAAAQQPHSTPIVHMASIEGLPLTKARMFDFQVQSLDVVPVKATMVGLLRLRSSGATIGYSAAVTLQPGMNAMAQLASATPLKFSQAALRELFLSYSLLPQGEYEYCVTVTPTLRVGESQQPIDAVAGEACHYGRTDDALAIDLIEPPDGDTLLERQPLLSWVPSHPLASQLEYRVRVVELRRGQEPMSATLRNRAMFEESNLAQPALPYPALAQPLEVGKTYAWRVDAYYRGLLLGGSEAWRFGVATAVPPTTTSAYSSYIDLANERGLSSYEAIGVLRMKYELANADSIILALSLTDEKGREVALPASAFLCHYGENRMDILLHGEVRVRHGRTYMLRAVGAGNRTYELKFKYINPDFY